MVNIKNKEIKRIKYIKNFIYLSILSNIHLDIFKNMIKKIL